MVWIWETVSKFWDPILWMFPLILEQSELFKFCQRHICSGENGNNILWEVRFPIHISYRDKLKTSGISNLFPGRRNRKVSEDLGVDIELNEERVSCQSLSTIGVRYRLAFTNFSGRCRPSNNTSSISLNCGCFLARRWKTGAINSTCRICSVLIPRNTPSLSGLNVLFSAHVVATRVSCTSVWTGRLLALTKQRKPITKTTL